MAVKLWWCAAMTMTLLTGPAPARAAAERRCGWLDNVTPGNFELVDRDGRWTIAQQGGYEAPGFDRLPDMSSKGGVATNGPHGYSCACITARTDAKSRRVIDLVSGQPRSLRQCRNDRTLPKR
ncbi:DUF4087 domain-containing protein [Sphingomonas endolithica]|uniref:DUF4087 domain-containing protein n=1 Tax=Sphingomonas endolithica TaxID=2972485 RepID=UPI0021AF19AB|nr:DUF4087 domain-containing protein [Sphingomonas sp. ZFBP2030]